MSRIRIVAVSLVLGAALSASTLAAGQTQKPDHQVVVQGQVEQLPLNDTHWALASAKLPVLTPEDRSRVTLAFRAGTLITMSSGCNRGSTSYSVSRTHELGISTYVVTRMACPGTLEQWEPAFFKFLGARPVVTLDGNDLVLKTADAEMKFKRVLVDRF
jgi:heat shock protein HslJ